VNIYDLLQVLVDDSNIGDKPAASELVRELRDINALGTMATRVGVAGQSHVHTRQEEPFDTIRHIVRCGVCREALSDPFFPNPTRSDRFGGRYT